MALLPSILIPRMFIYTKKELENVYSKKHSMLTAISGSYTRWEPVEKVSGINQFPKRDRTLTSDNNLGTPMFVIGDDTEQALSGHSSYASEHAYVLLSPGSERA